MSIEQIDKSPISEAVAATALEGRITDPEQEQTPADVARVIGYIASRVKELPVGEDCKRHVLVEAIDTVDAEIADSLIDSRQLHHDIVVRVARSRFYRRNPLRAYGRIL